MSRKRQASRSIGFSGEENPSHSLSLEELANSGYGDLGALTRGSGRLVARPTSIFEIYPDPAQPRRVIPSVVREHWDHDPHSIDALFHAWLNETNRERGGIPFDVDAYLRQDENFPHTSDPGPVESSFLKVLELAVSIRRDELANPITIAQKGSFFTIETGERRWLAFHFLNAYYGTADSALDGDLVDWSQIPARRVESVNVWRQASENNARDNLNAIGKARQFALLLMNLYGSDHFQRIESFEIEQDFYAQVADGNAYPIPRKQGDNVLSAMGLRDKSQIRRHRDLLRLPNIVWRWADDLGWAEGLIRKLVSKAKNEQELIQAAALEAKAEGLSVPIDTLPPSRKPATKKPLYTRGKRLASPTDRERFKLLQSIGENVTSVTPNIKRMLLQEVELHRQWLDQLERKIKG